jgi:hypothetical protein
MDFVKFSASESSRVTVSSNEVTKWTSSDGGYSFDCGTNRPTYSSTSGSETGLHLTWIDT